MTMKTEVDPVYSHAITPGDDATLIKDTIRVLIDRMATKHPDHVAYVFESGQSRVEQERERVAGH